MRRLFILAAGLLVLLTVATGIYLYQRQPSTIDQVASADRKLQVNGHLFYVTMADTPAKQTKGLSGVSSLQPDQGMYFPIQGQTGVSFWMKDMLIPIDIIWIKQGSIIGIQVNAPVPTPGTPDDQLSHYTSPVSQPDAVLEIAANQSKLLNLKVGDPVILLPE